MRPCLNRCLTLRLSPYSRKCLNPRWATASSKGPGEGSDLHSDCGSRALTTDRHRVTDDYPYGGGQGMVMKPEPLVSAIEDVRAQNPRQESYCFHPTEQF